MRQSGLLKSVSRILGDSVEVREAAYAWSRHRWITPIAILVLAAIVFLAPLAGIDAWSTRVALGLVGIAAVVMTTTDYRVVAMTDSGLVLLKASRIRQVATSYLRDFEPDALIELIGSVAFHTDWRVGDEELTVPKGSEEAMEQMAAAQSPGD